MSDPLVAKPPSFPKQTRYDLRDADGRLVAVHVRIDDGDGRKTFRWLQADGTSGLGGLRLADLPLYGAHLLRDRPAELVIVVEGEKAAAALQAAGLLAVGTVTGASTTPTVEELSPLVGRDVILWADNDEPGRAHMQHIAAQIQSFGVAPRIVEWPEAPPGGDAADFIDELGPGTALDRLLAAARPVHPGGTERPGRAILVRLADVSPKPVRWLWLGRIPLGKVTVLDGDPGLAKSLLSLDLAARVSTGRSMPDGATGDLDGPHGVVILSAEDDAEDTIRPRLDAAGADCRRVVLLAGVKGAQGERAPTIADLEALEQVIQQTDAAIAIVDPLMAYIPDERNAHRDQDIRRALAPLATLAARTTAAILVIRHLNKSSSGNPLYRGGGSIGIIGAARSGLLVASDPDDPDKGRRILVVTKSNLAAMPPALAYHVEAPDQTPLIVWEGQTAHSADALLAVRLPDDERSALDEAAAFLIDALAETDLPASEVKAAARQAGIAERTLERARHRAGVLARRHGFGRGAVYMWSLHARQSHEYGAHGVGTGEAGSEVLPLLARKAAELFNATILYIRPAEESQRGPFGA